MAGSKVSSFAAVAFLAYAIIMLPVMARAAAAHSSAPAPAPANDGTTIDQGIAYLLMLLALVLTYLIH
ncbi:hypothetical protein MLD38_025700 [Melastoma candidum]|uniref:Uncharacterized protein n=1 Tax=Melastoma candidum TaxID=119954 RepID=A0ACB9P1C5_9MYRT|nr:hypothetical protein MLD38_025700 [Melastoma candidum]